MKKRVVAVDFDDVLANFNGAYCVHHNEHYGTSISFEDIVDFDMCALYGIDQTTNILRVRHFCHNHHHQILPHQGAQEVLELLSDRYALHLLTSRCESLRDTTLEWLKRYRMDCFAEYHFTNGFGTLFPDKSRSKAQVCTDIGAVALIEDAPENAHTVAESGVSVILPHRPWNKTVQGTRIYRAHSWEDVFQNLQLIV